MNPWKFLRRISTRLFIAWLGLGLSSSPRYAEAKEIHDERFQGLQCENLSPSSLLSHLSRQQIDSAALHIPIPNWSFSVGLYDLANCWSLSRFQRLAYYLGRTALEPTEDSVERTLNMTRKFLPQVTGEDNHIEDFYAPSWTVFPWNATFFRQLQKGFDYDPGNGANILRTFKTDIELYQNYRFHNLIANFPFILGDKARPRWINRKSISRMKDLLSQNSLPLLLLRPALMSQHVVLAKRFEVLNAEWIRIWVYDSNYPKIENYMDYSVTKSQFYAPEIVRGMDYVKDPWHPVGVFIIDEGEKRDVLKFLVKYFKKRCETWAKN